MITDSELDAMEERAASAAWYTSSSYGKQVMGVDVPALIAEVKRLRGSPTDTQRMDLLEELERGCADIATRAEAFRRCEALDEALKHNGGRLRLAVDALNRNGPSMLPPKSCVYGGPDGQGEPCGQPTIDQYDVCEAHAGLVYDGKTI